MRNQFVLILLAALAPVFAGTVQFEAGESSMSFYNDTFAIDVTDNGETLTASIMMDGVVLMEGSLSAQGDRVTTDEVMSTYENSLVPDEAISLIGEMSMEARMDALTNLENMLDDIHTIGVSSRLDTRMVGASLTIGMGGAGVVGGGSTPAVQRIKIMNGNCHGACGPGCDWCIHGPGGYHLCYTNAFCVWHDTHCGAWKDFFNCNF